MNKPITAEEWEKEAAFFARAAGTQLESPFGLLCRHASALAGAAARKVRARERRREEKARASRARAKSLVTAKQAQRIIRELGDAHVTVQPLARDIVFIKRAIRVAHASDLALLAEAHPIEQDWDVSARRVNEDVFRGEVGFKAFDFYNLNKTEDKS